MISNLLENNQIMIFGYDKVSKEYAKFLYDQGAVITIVDEAKVGEQEDFVGLGYFFYCKEVIKDIDLSRYNLILIESKEILDYCKNNDPEFLSKVQRNNIIISDLITNQKRWIESEKHLNKVTSNEK